MYGYSDSASDEAFSRMFERDKNELRDLGIPLETGRISQFDPTEGYRINRDAYALPAVDLTADLAVILVAPLAFVFYRTFEHGFDAAWAAISASSCGPSILSIVKARKARTILQSSPII